MDVKDMDFDTFMIENKKSYDAKNARIIEVTDTVGYLQSEVYSAENISFILNGRLKETEETIINGDGFMDNYWLIDEVIKAMDSSLDLSLVEKGEPMPFYCESEESFYKHQIRDMKQEVITLLSLQYAVKAEINKRIADMARLSILNQLDEGV